MRRKFKKVDTYNVCYEIWRDGIIKGKGSIQYKNIDRVSPFKLTENIKKATDNYLKETENFSDCIGVITSITKL